MTAPGVTLRTALSAAHDDRQPPIVPVVEHSALWLLPCGLSEEELMHGYGGLAPRREQSA